jgi:hypothetical protein
MDITKEILDELLKDYQTLKTCSVRAVSSNNSPKP